MQNWGIGKDSHLVFTHYFEWDFKVRAVVQMFFSIVPYKSGSSLAGFSAELTHFLKVTTSVQRIKISGPFPRNFRPELFARNQELLGTGLLVRAPTLEPLSTTPRAGQIDQQDLTKLARILPLERSFLRCRSNSSARPVSQDNQVQHPNCIHSSADRIPCDLLILASSPVKHSIVPTDVTFIHIVPSPKWAVLIE